MNIIKVPKILLPKKDIDYTKWSVVACDQFTSQPDYWQKLYELAKDVPSSLHIIYPELYLGKDEEARIENINLTMKKYLDEGIFDCVSDSFILVERTTTHSDLPRFGLIMSVDLDAYEFEPFNKAYIKATEGTILERLPARIKIRQNARLELPHIILLLDDDKKTVIEPLVKDKNNLDVLYDFELNSQGGHLKGYKVGNPEGIIDKIYKLLDKDLQVQKYGDDSVNFLFAVGDGNHSLATAKACWDKIKVGLSLDEKQNHPARYALVEVVNIYDEALKFEPIHRVVFDTDSDFCLDEIKAKKLSPAQEIAALEDYIIDYIKNNPKASVDYIHGEEHLNQIIADNSDKNPLGIVMPSIDKYELFPYIVKRGVLAKKAFSMGEAEEKRYYLEAKSIWK